MGSVTIDSGTVRANQICLPAFASPSANLPDLGRAHPPLFHPGPPCRLPAIWAIN